MKLDGYKRCRRCKSRKDFFVRNWMVVGGCGCFILEKLVCFYGGLVLILRSGYVVWLGDDDLVDVVEVVVGGGELECVCGVVIEGDVYCECVLSCLCVGGLEGDVCGVVVNDEVVCVCGGGVEGVVDL